MQVVFFPADLAAIVAAFFGVPDYEGITTRMRTRKRDEYRAFNGATGAKQGRIPPIVEHHDGFSMWNTKYSEWNAAKMVPKRDIVDELTY